MMKRLIYLLFGALFSTGFSACTKAIILEGEAPAPITRVIKYDQDVQIIMYNHCVTCHAGTAASASLDLTNYQNVRASSENGNLLERIENTSDPMPPSGLLSAEDRQIIAKWAADGFPEN